MLRLGFAGTGAMAEYQVGKFRQLSSCEIVACVDRNPGNAENFARMMGIGHSYSSIDEMLAEGLCTALSCVANDRQHARLALAALDHGLPVFCEKPLARTVAECEMLARRAESSCLPTLVNFSKRNAPALAALKAVLESGDLGEVQSVEAEYLQGWVVSKIWGDWRTAPRWRWRLLPDESSAGVVGDLASHIVDALLYIFGGLAVQDGSRAINLAQALSSSEPSEEPPAEFLGGSGPVCVDLSANGLLPSGAPLTLRASWIEEGAADDFRIRVRGSKGLAALDLGRSRTSVDLQRFDSSMPRTVAGPAVDSTYKRFVELAEAPLDAPALVRRHGLPDFAHGLAVQRILDTLAPGGLPV